MFLRAIQQSSITHLSGWWFLACLFCDSIKDYILRSMFLWSRITRCIFKMLVVWCSNGNWLDSEVIHSQTSIVNLQNKTSIVHSGIKHLQAKQSTYFTKQNLFLTFIHLFFPCSERWDSSDGFNYSVLGMRFRCMSSYLIKWLPGIRFCFIESRFTLTFFIKLWHMKRSEWARL